MKYKIGETIEINNLEWRIAEYRMQRGREYMYTLAHEETDGTYVTMSLNERAMDGIKFSGGFLDAEYK
tara:strand:+ start:315 stop:518 length:204 start_codon:yes stop_codon:yes gene_type:complete